MNKTIKKIVSLGTGAMMLGATIGFAAAYDLSDYPSPFINEGVLVGKIVIGEKAAAMDVIGAVDIAASLQRDSINVGGATVKDQVTVENGYIFSENDKLMYGSNLNSVTSNIDSAELPLLLRSGTIESEDGTDYDYDVEIRFPAASTVKVEGNVNRYDLDDNYKAPIIYMDLGNGANQAFYDIILDFKDSWNSADFTNSETIKLFGKEYTFDPKNQNDAKYLTLFGSEITQIVTQGEEMKIIYEEKNYEVEILGGNSNQKTAIIRINGDTRTIREGDSRKIGGLPVYAKNVFINNIGSDDISVQLFIGSDKIEIEYDDTDGDVLLNGEKLDSVRAATSKTGISNWQSVNEITFSVHPSEDDVEYILPNEAYVDPLFGSFKFYFSGADNLMYGKESLKFERISKGMDIVFTPNGGSKETTLNFLENNATHEDFWIGATLENLEEDNIFIYTENEDNPDRAVTHILQVIKIKEGNNSSDSDFRVEVKDLTFDRTYVVNKCKALDSKIPLYPLEGLSEDKISFTDSSICSGSSVDYTPAIYTNAGAKLMFYNTTSTEIASASDIPYELGYINVTEDVQGDYDTSTPTSYLIRYRWDGTDREYDLSLLDKGAASGPLDDDEDNNHYLSTFGTYIVQDTDDSGRYVRMYIPNEEVDYGMYILPVSESVKIGNTYRAVTLNPIAVGMAILDTEANLGSKPYIIVGGPCANTVAAELMGNPVECTAGFTEGKAKIKLFNNKNALLVAGYTAQDTRTAANVISYYKDFELQGNEVEVMVSDLKDITINRVS
ncbi:MAG: S-layer protein [Candidatus Woesearchaeota archaeon]